MNMEGITIESKKIVFLEQQNSPSSNYKMNLIQLFLTDEEILAILKTIDKPKSNINDFKHIILTHPELQRLLIEKGIIKIHRESKTI